MKHFPDNSHMNNYEGWHYLGSANNEDYYMCINIDHKFAIGDKVLTSVVYGKEPEEYLSICARSLLSTIYFGANCPSHTTMRNLIMDCPFYETALHQLDLL